MVSEAVAFNFGNKCITLPFFILLCGKSLSVFSLALGSWYDILVCKKEWWNDKHPVLNYQKSLPPLPPAVELIDVMHQGK